MKRQTKIASKAKVVSRVTKKLVKNIQAFSKLSPTEKKTHVIFIVTDGVRTLAILTQSC